MQPQSITAPSFPHHRAGHCGSGALRDLLEFHRLDFGAGPLSEGTVFGLAGGLGFQYLEMPRMSPPIYLVGRTADLEQDVAPHLGLGLAVRSTDDAAEGWQWVREQIDAGSPPMVWADIGHLEYLRVRMHNTRHDVVIVDYDETEGIAWVADNDRDDLQRCSLASLARARASGAFPGPNRHTTFVYEWPERLRPPRRAVQLAMKTAIANMRGSGQALAGLPGWFGLEGVDRFAAAYSRWPETHGKRLPAVYTYLRVFILKAGTGGAMFRSLHASFLHEAGELLGDGQLLTAAATYRDLAAAWRSLADVAANEDHHSGLPLVATIAALEHRGVVEMEQWLAAAA